MSQSYILEIFGEAAGIVVQERGGVRFHSAEPQFRRLDRRLFKSVKAAEAAIHDTVRAGTAQPAQGPRSLGRAA